MKRLLNAFLPLVALSGFHQTASALVNNPSPYYQVSVLHEDVWESVSTYDALCSDPSLHGEIWDDWDNSKALRDTMSFAIVEDSFAKPLRVRVKNFRGFDRVEVRPSTYRIKTYIIDSLTVEFTVPTAGQGRLSVEFDGDRKHNLFLIACRPDPEKPSPDDPDVIYFGPGEHDTGHIEVEEGKTLYLDYGAIVYGSVSVTGSNSRIAGHGILSGERYYHHGHIYSYGKMLIVVNENRHPGFGNVRIEGITIIDSPSWGLTTFNCDNVLIDGVNMISWILNGDGIDIVCGKGITVRNCFLRNYDDCITLKVRHTADPRCDLQDVEVYNCTIFNDYARGIAVGVESGNTSDKDAGRIHDIDIHDCIILENNGSEDIRDLRAGIAIGQVSSPQNIHTGGTARNTSDIRIRNIVFDRLRPAGRCFSVLQYDDMDGKCRLENVLIENFTVYGAKDMLCPAALVITNQHSIRNMKVRNFVVDGRRINGPCADFVIAGDAEIKFNQ